MSGGFGDIHFGCMHPDTASPLSLHALSPPNGKDPFYELVGNAKIEEIKANRVNSAFVEGCGQGNAHSQLPCHELKM